MPDQTSEFDSFLGCPTWDLDIDPNAYNREANIDARKDDKNISYCAYFQDEATNGTKSSNVTRTITVDNYDSFLRIFRIYSSYQM